MVDWSGLLPELLAQVASGLTILEDFMAFRGVCTSWRAAATKDRFVSVGKLPLLMLAENGGSDDREFYSLSKRRICSRIPLPQARGKKCTEVGFGCILTLSSSGEVCLLKPFSPSAKFQLPDYPTFPIDANPELYVTIRGVLTANPSETSNFMLLVAVNQYMGFWMNGDEKWRMLDSPAKHIVYLSGKIYSLDMAGHVEIWDPHGTELTEPLEVVQVDGAPTSVIYYCDHYLVGSTDGELLLITRRNARWDHYIEIGAEDFQVMRVDLLNGECQEVDDLGKEAIFVGNNAAVSVDATQHPGVLKPNCIYFTDDRFESYFHDHEYDKGGGKDMGIYNVEDKSIERFEVESFSRLCPPLWIFPSFICKVFGIASSLR